MKTLSSRFLVVCLTAMSLHAAGCGIKQDSVKVNEDDRGGGGSRELVPDYYSSESINVTKNAVGFFTFKVGDGLQNATLGHNCSGNTELSLTTNIILKAGDKYLIQNAVKDYVSFTLDRKLAKTTQGMNSVPSKTLKCEVNFALRNGSKKVIPVTFLGDDIVMFDPNNGTGFTNTNDQGDWQ